ncbi:glycosyltransferase family 4 protein [Candidatus Woesearchaeota archaeon]|nr:glycosyltransferase family 4 protein [Candidatus Woesearchaeota archaeon]
MIEKDTDSKTAKKTILIATDSFLPRIDGIARFLEELLPELSRYNVIVICPNFSGTLPIIEGADYELHRVQLRKARIGDYQIPKEPKKFKSLVDKADIVFAQTIGPIGSTIINEAKKKNKKVISFIHSIEWILIEKSLSKWNLSRTLISLVAKAVARQIYSNCDALIVPSTNIGELYSLIGIKIPKYVVHLGIDTSFYKPSPIQEAKAELGIENDAFVIGFVGRIAREKDLFTLLKAFRKIEGKKKLLIVGDGIKRYKQRLKESNVIITGKKDNVVPYLNAMDVFVMPSLVETTCLAALEAMSCEVPVISTKVGNMRDYIKHKQNGLFFPKSNDTILALRMNYLKNNEKQRLDYGKQARKVVVSDYNWNTTKKKILKVIADNLKEEKTDESS